jgi:hypothetical protein
VEARKEGGADLMIPKSVKPLYIKPSEAPMYKKCMEDHKQNRTHIASIIAKQIQKKHAKEKKLALIYHKHAKKWKDKISKWEDETGRSELLLNINPSNRRRRSGVCASDYEEQQLVQQLIDREKRMQMFARTLAKCPPMHLSSKSKFYDSFSSNTNSRLTTDNAPMLCANKPVGTPCPPNCNCPRAVAKLALLVNPWSDIEKCIFIDKFIQYPKDFRKIASFLANKSTEECVTFYYNSKKDVNYKMLLHEHLLRRRGSKKSWTVTATSARNAGVKLPKEIWQGESGLDALRSILTDNTYTDMKLPIGLSNRGRGRNVTNLDTHIGKLFGCGKKFKCSYF